MAAKVDLFSPDLQVELPQELLLQPQEADPLPHIKAERKIYQAALLKWLRNNHSREALQSMRDAVHAVTECAPPNHERAFWWVACALLDCLAHDSLADDHKAMLLLSRIDLQMKSLLDEQSADTDATLRGMLYLIAHSQPVSDNVAAVKQVYALSSHLQPKPASPASLGQMQDTIRTHLGAAKESWEQCVRDGSALKEFTTQLAQLAAMAEQLGAGALQACCQQMQDTAKRIYDHDQIRRLGPEMAMALMLLNDGLEHYRDLGAEFSSRVHILDQRLRLALAGSEQNEYQFSELSALQRQAESCNATLLLLGEISSEFQRAQQLLLDLFGDRDDVPVLQRQFHNGRLAGLLHKAQNCLRFLGKKQPEPLLQALEHTANYFAEIGSHESGQFRPAMTALDALLKYVQSLLQKQNPEIMQLVAAQEGLDTLNLPTLAQPIERQVNNGTPGNASLPHKMDELLGVFLEEAHEVLDSLHSSLKALQLEPENHDQLISIRRSFHTLKGSSRMVGLTDLSDAAWAIERAINKWQQTGNYSATPSLLKLIQNATATFHGWIDSLNMEGSTHLETEELLDSIRQAEANFCMPSPAQQEIPAPPPTSRVSPNQASISGTKPPAIVIGSVTLSPALFKIATQDAAQHSSLLLRQLNDLRTGAQPAINYDIVRTVHMLAAVYRTTGFTAIAELAFALEQWLKQCIGQSQTMNSEQLALLEQSVTALQDMGAAILKHNEPQAQPSLVSLLHNTPSDPSRSGGKPQPAPPSPPVAPVHQPSHEQSETGNTASSPLSDVNKRVTQDEMDEQLLLIFLEEADDLYPQAGSTLRAWRRQPDNKQLGRSLQRNLHTLKGSARMAGAMRLGGLTHRLEDKIVQAMDQVHHDTAFWDELENYLDRIGGIVEQLRNKRTATGIKPGKAETALPEGVAGSSFTAETGPGHTSHTALLRIRPDTLDNLVNEAGEISVTHSRIESELREFKIGLLELSESVSHLRAQLREIEIQAESQLQENAVLTEAAQEKVDPLEIDRLNRFQKLTRFMNESVHDVQTVQRSLLKNLEEAATALSGQAYLNRKLQQDLLDIRMVPFASIAERLYRVVRQTCKELSKKVNLELLGTDVEIDRSMLEKMAAPFEHLLRNSIAHGLENSEQRKQAGKPPIGEIRLTLHQEGNEVIFEYSDDGAGMDFDALCRKARLMGLLHEGAEASDEQIMQMVFTSGLTTAAKVTEVSGRGVGMDVVRSEIAALGGRITAFSERGKGVRFLIHLPLTLAASHILMVRAGQEIYAIPSAMAEAVIQAKPEELRGFYQCGQIEWQGKSYPVHYLPHLLGRENCAPENKAYNRLLLLHSSGQRLALHTDELIGKQEAVIKKIGQQLSHVPGVTGATVLGNGKVVLIINPVQLAQRNQNVYKATPVMEPVSAAPLVMIVDDSLTMRKNTSRLLARAGYQVATAKDGLDALEQIGEIIPAILLLDTEMPRMDGFELIQHLRQNPKTRDLPIIITSLTVDKYHDYARESGVSAYIAKPYQEEELLQQIASFAGAPAPENP